MCEYKFVKRISDHIYISVSFTLYDIRYNNKKFQEKLLKPTFMLVIPTEP